jgi:colanic acid/amylovoran biosynthesis glycosyltransferase
MRVAALVHRFPSLSQTFVLNQITGLLEQGCDLEIFADGPDHAEQMHPDVSEWDLPSRTRYYGIPANYVNRLWHAGKLWRSGVGGSPQLRRRAIDIRRYGLEAASLRLLFEARALAERGPYDVVHAHFGPSGALAAQLRDVGALHGPIVTSFYGYDVTRVNAGRGYAFLFRHGDRFIAISERMRARLIALGCDPRRIIVHRLGVDLRRFEPVQRPARSYAHIVTIARFVPKKGLEYGLRAVAALARQRDIRYTIIGDGPLRHRLTALVHALRLEETVRFAGWQTQPAVIALLQQADVLLAPSATAGDGDAEGMPTAIIEAHALAVPVVATWHEGIPEVVTHGESGFLVAERDVAALSESLARLVESPELRRKMGEAGRALVMQQHDSRTLNRELLEIFADLRESAR